MENKRNITVFGATGKIGAVLLQSLSHAQQPVIAVTRDLGKAIPLPFVAWVEADMSDPCSLHRTMADSQTVMLMSGIGPDYVEEQNNVIEAAKAARVGHIVKLSSGAADPGSSLFIARAHGAIEELLKASGVSWTILRPGGFMQNWLGEFAPTVKKERKIYGSTGEGKRAYIDLRDIADIAFTVLIASEKHAGKTYLLTGGEAVNLGQIAASLSQVIGEEVSFVPLTEQQAWRQMESKGMPYSIIHALLAYAQSQRQGETAFVSPDVPEILQRPARTVNHFLKEYAQCFQ